MQLDREETSSYDLIITATDNPPEPGLQQSIQQSTTTTVGLSNKKPVKSEVDLYTVVFLTQGKFLTLFINIHVRLVL